MALDRLHGEADRLEHRVSPLEIERIADALSHPRYDPHGDPIPTRRGVLPEVKRVALCEWPHGKEGRIAHIEDEPAAECQELVAMGVCRGARVRVWGESLLWHHGREIPVPGRLWKMIGVEPLAGEENGADDCRTLADFSQ